MKPPTRSISNTNALQMMMMFRTLSEEEGTEETEAPGRQNWGTTKNDKGSISSRCSLRCNCVIRRTRTVFVPAKVGHAGPATFL